MPQTPAPLPAPSGVGPDIETEYRSIETALLESARGRWFLAEHGRRARRLDSALLEDALGRLQSSLRQPPALLGQLAAELSNLKRELETTRSRLLGRPPTSANNQPASAGLLRATEDLHQLAWALQANDIDVSTCEQIAQKAASIYGLSVSQAVESQRSVQFAANLDAAITRVDAVMQTITHEAMIDGEGSSAVSSK